MAKTDFQLLIALLAPVLIWPWLTEHGHPSHNGLHYTIALFTLIPVAEEMVFRGWLQGWLLQKDWFKHLNVGASRANWFTSMAFAVAHLWQHAFILLPGYFVVSLVLGHFRERYRGIAVPILLHGYYNLGLIVASG